MFNSSEGFSPLYMPYECVRFPADPAVFPLDVKGSFDVKFFLLKSGSLEVENAGEKTTMSAGDVLVICPDHDFTMKVSGDAVPELLVIRIDPNQMGYPVYTPELKNIYKEAARQHMPALISAEEARENKLTELAEECAQEDDSGAYGWETMELSLVRQLSLRIIRLWRKRGLKYTNTRIEDDPMFAVTAYIHQHVQDGLRVEELASRCNLSYPWFAKKFREMYGLSCKEYIERVRVSRVEAFLCYTDWDLTEISRITGYADCSHMIKNFKRLKHTTPGQFRMNHRG